MQRLYLHNLGCSKNQIDGEMFAGWVEKYGIELLEDPEEADVIVINTCAFIDAAKEEAIDAILEAARYKSEASCRELYVCGCFPQLHREQLQADLPEVDGFYGIDEWPALLKKIAGEDAPGKNPYLERHLWTPKHYAYIRIADGCDRRCAYCIIPDIRGKYRSRSIDEIVEEAEMLAGKGVKELLVVAQELNSYGHDLYSARGNLPLIDLLKQLTQIDDIEWVRPLYLHPPACDEELLQFWAKQPKLLHYLDFPIEHASNAILRSMGRGGLQKQIRKHIARARQLMDDVVIRTSIIVGYPGETRREFEELLEFVREIRFERMGSFQFSAEEGTPAATLPDQVPVKERDLRQAELMSLQAEISHDLNLGRVGEEAEVFIDSFEEESGYSIAHGKKELPELDGEILIQGQFPIGKKMKVVISAATEYDLFAATTDQTIA